MDWRFVDIDVLETLKLPSMQILLNWKLLGHTKVKMKKQQQEWFGEMTRKNQSDNSPYIFEYNELEVFSDRLFGDHFYFNDNHFRML